MPIKKWKTEVVRMVDVVLDDKNARIIDPARLKGLQASIGRFGMVELIIWNERTGHIVGGHQRFAVLSQSGVTEAPMIVVEMSLQEEMAASLALNNPQIEGEFDEPIMELLGQVEKSAPELYKAVRMDELRSTLEKSISMDSVGDNSSDTPPTVEWDTECPCCGNKWKIDSKDIVVLKGQV